MRNFEDTRTPEGLRLIMLHYSADPDKDPATEKGKTWFEEESRNWPGGTRGLKWRREMEIDFSAGVGELVFPHFDEEKVVVEPFEVTEKYNLFGGFDWGTRNYTSFHVYAQSKDNVFFSVWEYYQKRQTVEAVARILWETCPYMRRLEWIAADPTIYSETVPKNDGFTSVHGLFQEVEDRYQIDGFMPAHGRSDQAGIAKADALFIRNQLKFFNCCPYQISEFKNLKYPERTETRNETEKILDKDNHSWDEFKYMILSHPYGKDLVDKPTYGTVGYGNKCTQLAIQRAKQSGRSVQEEFNDIYGAL